LKEPQTCFFLFSEITIFSDGSAGKERRKLDISVEEGGTWMVFGELGRNISMHIESKAGGN
jgi:hypothetical protein